MIEVLISVVILSIGLLGVAGLQVMGMRNNHSAYLRTQATTLAYQFADILRSNLTEVKAKKTGSANTTLTAAAIKSNYGSAADGTYNGCSSLSGCSSALMMQYDLLTLVESIEATLPEGDVTIINPASFNDTNVNYLVFGITVTWKDDRSNNVTKSFTTSFRP